MNNKPSWLFDESLKVGVDYSDKDIVDDYDKSHNKFRDFEKEAKKIADDLKLTKESTILDFGCGTGGIAVHLAKLCKHVYAVDASLIMISKLKEKIVENEIQNITPIQSGFLTYEHKGESVDAVISSIALHHLPDFWKQIALINIYDLLKPKGKLFLIDVIFNFPPMEYKDNFDSWIASMNKVAGKQIADETAIHIKEEYSTFDWIMTGLIEKAGFVIERKVDVMKNIKAYICLKK